MRKTQTGDVRPEERHDPTIDTATSEGRDGLSVSRRAFVTGAPLALLPGAAAGQEESEILRLFRHHEWLRRQHEAAWRRGDRAAEDRLYERMTGIAERLMAIPSVTAADFAAKAIVDTCRGELFPDWESGALWIEARRLTGFGGRDDTPPVDHLR